MTPVRLLSLDAGNTIVFLDHELVARLVTEELARHGVRVDAARFDGAAVARAEGIAKLRLDRAQLLPALADKDITPAWSAFMATLVQVATEVDAARAGDCVRALWAEHRRFNLWRKVPAGLVDAVAELRTRGVPVVVVSNSEGQLHELFDKLGLGGVFDFVVDSHHVGVEKPDPRIFHIVLERFGVSAAESLHLGDTYATDVVGARAAGMQVALIDPFDHYAGEYADVLRVTDVAAVCRTLVSGLT